VTQRAWQAEAVGLPVEGPGQVSLDGASARAAVELLYGLQMSLFDEQDLAEITSG
jgi:hypothetical protein